MVNCLAITNEILLTAVLLSVIAFDLIVKDKRYLRALPALAGIGISISAVVSVGVCSELGHQSFMGGLFVLDSFAAYFKSLFCFAVAVTLCFSSDYIMEQISNPGEFISLCISALLGMCVMASANDFITAFVGLELMTVSFYILAALAKDKGRAGEAAVKYLLVGAASTAIMLYGISLVYGAGGSLIFSEIKNNVHLFYGVGVAGVSMVIIGFFFKLSVVPFHMWAPDVYQGAPLPVTCLLAMGSKAAAIAMFMRVLYTAFPILANYWLPMLAFFSAACMVAGNIMALRQTDVKRMLAYSSIAQAGYMMAGIVAADAAGMKAVMFYIQLYMIANIGAFAVLAAVEPKRGGTTHAHIAGLAQSAPLLAAVMTVSLLSMAGIPPTAGFAGKIYLFSAVVDRGYLWLAFVGFVMSMISVYYYLMVTKAMYRDLTDYEAEIAAEPLAYSPVIKLVAVCALVGTVLLGVWPEPIAQLAGRAAAAFMM
ncbi:MAG: NADH-quinone oxidoreductase subunit N [Selenomonadaceae bacterium]|nr:NADH-quinone oxidoreductase subunit N [Selenomonadaceae bacterium]